MLGCDLELTRYVMLYELSEEGVVVVVHQIVKSDAGANEHLFNLIDLLYLAKHMSVLGVIDLQMLTRCGREALACRAYTGCLLLITGRITEIGGGTSHVVYIALEIGHRGNESRLGDDALLAPRAHLASLVKGDGAEVAGAEAASVIAGTPPSAS